MQGEDGIVVHSSLRVRGRDSSSHWPNVIDVSSSGLAVDKWKRGGLRNGMLASGVVGVNAVPCPAINCTVQQSGRSRVWVHLIGLSH